MFQFNRFALLCGYSSNNQVSPFGNLRINSYLLIPGAYRSLSRPSSPLRAKASPVYPSLLSSTHTLLLVQVCLYVDSYVDFWTLDLSIMDLNPLSICLSSFNLRNCPSLLFLSVLQLLLPICQRTSVEM